METPKVFVKIKRKNSNNINFRVYSYVRQTLTDLDIGFRKERKPKEISHQ